MLFGFPLQVFSGLASFLISFIASRSKAKMEMEEAKHKRMMELIAASNESASQFMQAEEIKQKDPYFSFTRRILALGLTFGTMVAIFIIPVVFPQVPWIFEVNTSKSLLFGLLGTEDITEFVQVAGIPFVFGEAFTHIVAVITSFYFGNKLGNCT